MIEEITDRLRAGYVVVGMFARLSGLFFVGSVLQIIAGLEQRGRRGRSSEHS